MRYSLLHTHVPAQTLKAIATKHQNPTSGLFTYSRCPLLFSWTFTDIEMLLSYVQLFHDLESKKFDPESKRFGPESIKFGNYLDSGFELQATKYRLQGPVLKSKPTTSLQGTKYCLQEVVGIPSAAVHEVSSLQTPGPITTHAVR